MSNSRVVVAMSGGVDSSVAAAILSDEGYEVVGVTLNLFGERDGEELQSRASASVEGARAVAEQCSFDHHVLDCGEEFEEFVIEPFCQAYLKGETPNPCVFCNPTIKFGRLLQEAQKLGAETVATGHHAQVRLDEGRERWLLVKGFDPLKDQSYALYRLSQEQLGRALFPVGGMTKTETRSLARQLGLPTAGKAESQEICFVPGDDYRAFLRARYPDAIKPGPIVDRSGRKLGEHTGLPFYTVGQRKGLGIAAREPLYVVSLDFENNSLVVGQAEDVFSDSCRVRDVNWIACSSPDRELRADVKIRYRHEAAPATVVPQETGRVLVRFDSPQRAMTPGQSAVFYAGDVVVGGGIIGSQA